MKKTAVPKLSPMKLRGRPGVLFQTPYDEMYVAQLKGLIPNKRDRWFNEHRRGWWIAEEHVDLVTHLTRETFGAMRVVDDEGHEIIEERSGERLEQGRLL